MRVLEAPGLVLEPQTRAHAEAMFAVLSDPAVYEYEMQPPASVGALRERFARLESRCSEDGREHWLNWVIRVPDGDLAGFVQATVQPGGRAAIAYILGSRYWGRGIASRAVRAMIGELRERYGARELTAVLKHRNQRSLRLLERLGFEPASEYHVARIGTEADELLYVAPVDAALSRGAG